MAGSLVKVAGEPVSIFFEICSAHKDDTLFIPKSSDYLGIIIPRQWSMSSVLQLGTVL